MRIIAGTYGGRLLKPSMKNWPTRPTTDIAKEAIFNILQNRLNFEEVNMLDLFGGTGNHSFEFISRGCSDVTYVELHSNCVNFVKWQSAKFGCESSIGIIQGDVKYFVCTTSKEFDYIFAGPPYPLIWLHEIPDLIIGHNLLTSTGILVLEHNPSHDFSNHAYFKEKRKYGQTIFSFFAI